MEYGQGRGRSTRGGGGECVGILERLWDGDEGGGMQERGVKWLREGDGVVVKGWVRWKMRDT